MKKSPTLAEKLSSARLDELPPVATFYLFSEAWKRYAAGENPLQLKTDVRAFAFFWWSKESALTQPGKSDFESSGEVIRLLQWAEARLRWHLFIAEKECPDLKHSDPGIREAALAGILAAYPVTATDPRVTAFLHGARTRQLVFHKRFLQWAANPKPARWDWPLLDSWLFCIWPIVTRYGWRYCDVLTAALEKFKDEAATTEPGTPFQRVDAMKGRCLSLGLKTRNTKPGPVKQTRRKYRPPMLDLALLIPAELFDNSPFSKVP